MRLEQPFQERPAVRGVAGAQPLHYGLTTHDLDVLVLREAPIGGSSRGGQASLEGGDEGRRLGWHAGLLGVARDVAAVFVPGDELGAVVAVLLAAWDEKVARLQLVDHLREQADLEVAPVHLGGCWLTRRAPGQQRPPFLAHPGQVERPADWGGVGLHHVHGGPQLGAPVRAVRQQKGDRLLGGAVLRCRDQRGVGQEAQEGRALAAVEAGEQGQVVVAGKSRVRLALGQNRVGVGQQQALDRLEPGVPLGLLVLAGQHGLAQQRDQGVGLGRVLGAVVIQRLLGPVVHPGH